MEFTFTSLLKNIIYFGGLSAITAAIISPLQFLKVMRQQTGDRYLVIIEKSYKKGGIKIFYRGIYPYSMLNFYSSAAFGISEFFTVSFLMLYSIEASFIAVFIRSLVAGIIETACTVKAEVQEITKNKGDLMKQLGKASSIIEAIFFRNTFFWMGSLLSLYFITKIHLSSITGAFLAFILGIIIAIVTLPFDIVATHNCGDDEKCSVFNRIRKIITENGRSTLFYGSLVRIIQVAIFTMVTTITEMILH